eukprot:COSAG02_NODE_7361_length_3048_cov_10.028155_2_plen_149_part_00
MSVDNYEIVEGLSTPREVAKGAEPHTSMESTSVTQYVPDGLIAIRPLWRGLPPPPLPLPLPLLLLLLLLPGRCLLLLLPGRCLLLRDAKFSFCLSLLPASLSLCDKQIDRFDRIDQSHRSGLQRDGHAPAERARVCVCVCVCVSVLQP